MGVAQPVSSEKKNWGIPSEIMVAVVAQPVSTILGSLPNYTFGNQGCSGCSTSFNHSWNSPKLYLWKSGLQWLLNRFQPFSDLSQTIPSEIKVAVVAQPVSTEKKMGYTFENHGCSGCSTSFNHSWISPKLYLRKSGLQWLLNRFQPKKKIGVYLRKSWLQWLLNRFQPFSDLSQTIPSEIRVAVVAQPVSTEKKIWGIPSE